jgi:hypothetical protein
LVISGIVLVYRLIISYKRALSVGARGIGIMGKLR